MNKGLVKGIVKISFVVFILALIGFFVFNYILPVFAATHTSTATLDPVWTTCGAYNTFTVNVTNNGPDPVREVRIYNGSYPNIPPHTDFSCGPAPTGWVLIDQHQYGFPYCQYQASGSPYWINSTQSLNFTFNATTTTESNYSWGVETYDTNLAWQSLQPYIIVDCTPPETTKYYVGPQKKLKGVEWISNKTLVYLNATDTIGSHDSKVKETRYRNELMYGENESYCWNYCEFYKPHDPKDSDWTLYDGPFHKEEESCHVIEYYSVDNLNNTEKVKWQCVFVDNTPPIGNKIVGEPKIVNETGGFTWVTNQTSITFECEDQQPHPVNQEIVWWRISLDGAWGDWQSAPAPKTIYFKEDSWHDLEFYCVDHLGNKEETHDVQYYKVDSTPPSIKKTIGEPKYWNGTHWFINTSTDICLYANDSEHGIGVDNIQYRYRVNCCGEWTGWFVYDSCFNFPEYSVHEMEYYANDSLGNKEVHSQTLIVDNTPPKTTKWYGEPNVTVYWEGLKVTWINSSTPIYLDAEDQQPHPSGVNETWYKILWYNETLCNWENTPSEFCEWEWYGWFTEKWYQEESSCYEENNSECVPVPWYIKTDWVLYWYQEGPEPVPFTIDQESLHKICYYSIDKLGNKEEKECQVVVVDNTPPQIWKNVGEPKVESLTQTKCSKDLTNPGFETGDLTGWTVESAPDSVTVVTNIYTTPLEGSYMARLGDDNDGGGQPIGNNTISQTFTVTESILRFAYNIFTTDYAPFNHFGYRVTRTSDNAVIYEYNQTAWGIGFGLKSTGWQVVNLDLSAYIGEELKLTISSGGTIDELHSTWTYVDCGGLNVITWITQNTPINLYCEDKGEHLVNGEKIWYRYKVNDGNWTEWRDPNGENKTIYFPEDSNHTLQYYCEDALGNAGEVHEQYYVVDTKPPVTTKEIIGPQFYNKTENKTYIDTETEIKLLCEDQEPHPVGVDNIQYRYRVNCCGEWTGWNNYSLPFSFPEESHHELEYYCNDTLGNEEEHHIQEYYVDKKPPITTKWYEGPYYKYNNSEWINSSTLVHLDAVDQVPHPSGVNKTYYRNTLVEDFYCLGPYYCEMAEGLGDFVEYTKPFNKSEESCHLIEYYSVDNVNKTEEVNKQCVYVDNTPPITTKEIIGPEFYNETENKTYIDGVTKINLTCTDPGPHPSGKSYITYRYYWNGSWTDWNNYSLPFSFPEESHHELEYYCNDTLGNEEEHHIQEYYVDKKPPKTTKWYEGYEEEPKWITTSTLIHLNASDSDEEHASGVKATYWRNTLVDQKNCIYPQKYCKYETGSGDWNLYIGPFQKSEESCHLIEYYSVDNVNKTEEVNKQCVFVDDTPPTPVKTVGEPKVECSEGDWCDWKITTMTPIKLNCTDTHVVGNQKVCYRTYLDGELQDDWTCVNSPETIYFNEESNHTIEYYCKDWLRNGSIDSENFKVEGTSFELNLKKKWNLISVPFVLWDSNITKVLGNASENISAIWTYDGETNEWYVYTPDDGPDSLTDLIPGWGYWVLAKNDTKILIAGGLFSPITTPASRNLVKGWNLIGYYGTDWQDYGGDPYCGDGDVFWRYAYCALSSLVDTQEGYPRWSSLWTYVNCANNPWKGLNACTTIPSKNKMVAGYGYWIEMDVDDTYAPATVCYQQTKCKYWPGPYP